MSPTFRFTIFSALALFLIQYVALSAAQQGSLTKEFYSAGPSEPIIYFLTESFQYNAWPYGVAGVPKIVVTTDEDIQICISGWAPVQNIAACNGSINNFYFFVPTTNASSSEEEFTDSEFLLGREDFYNQKRHSRSQNLYNARNQMSAYSSSVYLRGVVPYFLNIFLHNSTEKYYNQTNSIVFTLIWNYVLCNPPYVGLPSGGCAGVTWQAGTDSVPPNSKQPFILASPIENAFASKLVTSFILSALNVSDSMSSFAINIYLRQGTVPTNTTYDAVLSVPVDFNTYYFNFSLPSPGVWFYMLDNPTDDQIITISAMSNYTACPGNSVGVYCNTSLTDLTNINTALLMNGTGDYQYFTLKSPTLLVGVGNYSTNSNAPDIYASYVNLPISGNNILQATGAPVNFLYSSISPLVNVTTQVWYISVWANQSEQYYIWANTNCPNNCSTNGTLHGNCTTDTGVCVCDSGYSGIYCSPNAKKKGLATWAKAVIAVVVIVVVAIIIGIIVGLVLRNRRKHQYQRIDGN